MYFFIQNSKNFKNYKYNDKNSKNINLSISVAF